MPPKKEAAAPSATTVDPTVQLQQNAFIRSALEATNRALKARLEELGNDVDLLRDTRATLARDAADFMDYSTRELSRLEGEVTEGKEGAVRLRLALEGELARTRAEAAAAAREAQARYDALDADTSAKLRERDARIQRAQEMLELRDRLEGQVEELTAALEEERERRVEEVADAERRMIVEKNRLEREAEHAYVEMKKQARAEVTKAMDAETKRFIHDSRIMSKELTLQTAECRVLFDERGTLADASKTLKRDVELLREAEREWAARTASKEATNKELAARCAQLEELLLRERRDRVAEYGSLLKAVERETEDVRLELSGLRSLMALKNRELRTVKKLAQIVLNQRTEVEQFFLDALTQVKLDIARRRADAHAAAAAATAAGGAAGGGGAGADHHGLRPVLRSPVGIGGGAAAAAAAAGAKPGGRRPPPPDGLTLELSVPPPASPSAQQLPPGVTLSELTAAARRSTPSGTLAAPSAASADAAVAARGGAVMAWSGAGGGAGGPSSSSSASASGLRVDVTDLTPEDRERVLRLLFAKINNMEASGGGAAAGGLGSGGFGGGSTQRRREQQHGGLASPSPRAEAKSGVEGKEEEAGDGGFGDGGGSSPTFFGAGLSSDPDDLRNAVYFHGGHGVGGKGDGGDLDAGELAAALGAKARERVELARVATTPGR
jgi:hypothetical protein